MIRPIIRDVLFLSGPSSEATMKDLKLAVDLTDTLRAHASECVGMAANMIGESRRVIVFDDEGKYTVMFNPEIIRAEGGYEAEEGCLSLTGQRKARRYEKITVRYRDVNFKKQQGVFTGFAAQIIQHEVDHCNGIII